MRFFMPTNTLFGLSCHTRNCERLLTLLLVLVGVGKAVFPVHGKSINLGPPTFLDFSGILRPSGNQTIETQQSTTEIRHEILYNMCSKLRVRVLRIGKRGVNAKGRKNGPLNTLVFQNAGPNTFRIFGLRNGFYICFNKRGKLITRKNGKKKLCQFIEREDGGFLKYQTADSRYNWFMGFKKNGKPMKGHSKKTRRPECFQFLKEKQEYLCSKKGETGIQHCKYATGLNPETMTPVRHSKHRRGKQWKG